MISLSERDRIIRAVDDASDEMITFVQELVRFDTSVPPGNNYPDCAEHILKKMKSFGFEGALVEVPHEYCVKITEASGVASLLGEVLPRVNVFSRREGSRSGRVMHFTGHFDVVPVGNGWTMDPFSGIIRDGKLYGRGSTDQKSGIAASLFAMEAIKRAGISLPGAVELSATVDEEWFGEMGMGYLVEQGYIGKGKQDYIVITECLDVDGICIGHRGALLFTLMTKGRIGHGCMPQYAVNALDKMISVASAINSELRPAIESRISAEPIMPEIARQSTLSPIWMDGAADKKPGATIPAVCTSFWNRWYNPEETPGEVRQEILDFLQTLKEKESDLDLEFIENYSAEPVLVPSDSLLVNTYRREINAVIGRDSHTLLSPGFDDQRFVVNNGRIDSCILYGPGILQLAHAPDEYVLIEDVINAAKVMALATADLLSGG